MFSEEEKAARFLSWWRDFVQASDGTPGEWRPEIWNQMCDWLDQHGKAE